jgi:hypothetical protein
MRLRELIRHLGPRLRGRTPVLNYAQEHTFDFTRFTLRAAHLRSGLKIVRSRTYEYPGGALNLWRKKGERPAKAAARAAFILVAKIFHLENILGSYLQVFSKGKA